MSESARPWERRDPTARLADAEESRSFVETTLAEAQVEVNFVVFEFGWLPEDCRLTAVTLRPERPPPTDDGRQDRFHDGNPCTVRAVVEGSDRTFRMKQFLYDRAPPAASVAPLWETPEPEPVECADAVGWLGTDYKDNRGACVQRARTQIEVSVLDGEFGDDELTNVLCGLEEAAPEEARPVRAAPFHALNYWFRYKCDPYPVIHGLWNHYGVRPFGESVSVAPFALHTAPVPPLVPDPDRFLLDSAVAFPGASAVDCVFRHRGNGSDHLWLTAADEASTLAPTLPPEPSDQPARTREEVELRDATVHYAALTETHGGWEAFWSEDGVRYAVWAGASRLLDGEEFRRVIDELARPRGAP